MNIVESNNKLILSATAAADQQLSGNAEILYTTSALRNDASVVSLTLWTRHVTNVAQWQIKKNDDKIREAAKIT